jgi:hypothetical protein
MQDGLLRAVFRNTNALRKIWPWSLFRLPKAKSETVRVLLSCQSETYGSSLRNGKLVDAEARIQECVKEMVNHSPRQNSDGEPLELLGVNLYVQELHNKAGKALSQATTVRCIIRTDTRT